MPHRRYILFLLLVGCVSALSRNNTTYTFNPRVSQVKFLSLPKSSLFLGTSHKQSGKSEPEDAAEDRFADDTTNNEEPAPEEQGVEENPQPEETEPQSSQTNENAFLNEGSTDQGVANAEEQRNNDQPYGGENSPQPSEAEANKQIVEDIAKEEQMKDMHEKASSMLDSAKEAKRHADDLVSQYKQGSFNSDTNRQTMPKGRSASASDDAGNIIITNTTTSPKPPAEEEKVDPLKAIRDATLSLFERAKHKNLPVPEPGRLATPEELYSALNALEQIIDGYRNSKIDIVAERAEQALTDIKPDEGQSKEAAPEEAEAEPDRFLQVRGWDEDEDDEAKDENEDGEENQGEDFHSEDSEEGQDAQFDADSEEQAEKKPETVSPHKAREHLLGVIKELSSVLERVVHENIGVRNVISKEITA